MRGMPAGLEVVEHVIHSNPRTGDLRPPAAINDEGRHDLFLALSEYRSGTSTIVLRRPAGLNRASHTVCANGDRAASRDLFRPACASLEAICGIPADRA